MGNENVEKELKQDLHILLDVSSQIFLRGIWYQASSAVSFVISAN